MQFDQFDARIVRHGAIQQGYRFLTVNERTVGRIVENNRPGAGDAADRRNRFRCERRAGRVVGIVKCNHLRRFHVRPQRSFEVRYEFSIAIEWHLMHTRMPMPRKAGERRVARFRNQYGIRGFERASHERTHRGPAARSRQDVRGSNIRAVFACQKRRRGHSEFVNFQPGRRLHRKLAICPNPAVDLFGPAQAPLADSEVQYRARRASSFSLISVNG